MTDISLRGKGGVGAKAPYHNEAFIPDGYTTGKYYMADVDWRYILPAITVANQVFMLPFTPKTTHTFTGLVFVVGSGTPNIRVGIYESGTDNFPQDLLLESGSTTAATGVNEVVISQSLTANTPYWLAFQTDSNANIYGLKAASSVQSAATPTTGAARGLTPAHFGGVSHLMSCPQLAHTYGAFPNPISGWVHADSTTQMPFIMLKA